MVDVANSRVPVRGRPPSCLNNHAEDEEQSVDGPFNPATVAPRGAIPYRFGRFRELYPLSSSSVGGTLEVENCCCLLGTTAREVRPSKRGLRLRLGLRSGLSAGSNLPFDDVGKSCVCCRCCDERRGYYRYCPPNLLVPNGISVMFRCVCLVGQPRE